MGRVPLRTASQAVGRPQCRHEKGVWLSCGFSISSSMWSQNIGPWICSAVYGSRCMVVQASAGMSNNSASMASPRVVCPRLFLRKRRTCQSSHPQFAPRRHLSFAIAASSGCHAETVPPSRHSTWKDHQYPARNSHWSFALLAPGDSGSGEFHRG